jgi:hypothetical protein
MGRCLKPKRHRVVNDGSSDVNDQPGDLTITYRGGRPHRAANRTMAGADARAFSG